MKYQMLSPWEKKIKIWYDETFYRALAYLFDVCKKISTVVLKGQGFSQTLQDVFFSLLLICLALKYFSCGILIKRMLGFKV